MKFWPSAEKLKILFVTTEESPFAKVGGLGEVMFSLPRALRRLGHDARVMIPRYGTIPRNHGLRVIQRGLEVPTSPDNQGPRLACNVLAHEGSGTGPDPAPTYLLENQEYYELRSNAYGYIDDRIRFALLSRGALEFLNLYREWTPDVITSTDWMTGFLPDFLRRDYSKYTRLENIASVFSIHNLASQGPLQHHRFVPETERDDGHSPIPDFFGERMNSINSMRRGILHADIVNTVSPTYAQEIMTEEFGEGLDSLLRERRGRLYGILNGIDYETNDPGRDPLLAKNFSSQTLDDRIENKTALQKRFGLPENKNSFVLGIVSRLQKQKGFDLLRPIIDSLLKSTSGQLIVLGEGEPEIMQFFHELAGKFPQQVGVHLQFDDELSRLIYAGTDVLLIPSLFEPAGLVQMEAMRFGAIPVANNVGGLADTVEDFIPEKDRGTGFLFKEPSSTALLIAAIRAFVNWRHQEPWQKMQRRAMEKDFSWERSAVEYVALFEKAIKLHQTDLKKTDTP